MIKRSKKPKLTEEELINQTVERHARARARTIANAESSRVQNTSALKRYKEGGLTKVKWSAGLVVSGGSVPCDKCAENDGQIVEIGASFNSGHSQPPAHLGCSCYLSPVFPDYEEFTFTLDSQGVTHVNPPEVTKHGVTESQTESLDSNKGIASSIFNEVEQVKLRKRGFFRR